jgi:RNA polymerase sigma factor (sigma-70 family)
MDEVMQAVELTAEDRRIGETIEKERNRLRNFIRKRVPDVEDAEDILQDVFYELVEATRLMKPIERVSAWLFRVARNRITDLFRRKRTQLSTDGPVPGTGPWTGAATGSGGGSVETDKLLFQDLLPSPDAGPEAAYARHVLLEELDAALDELPDEQRDVFIAHEIEGRSFKELAVETGLSVNTLLARKHYAVVRLRRRLQVIHDEFHNTRGETR